MTENLLANENAVFKVLALDIFPRYAINSAEDIFFLKPMNIGATSNVKILLCIVKYRIINKSKLNIKLNAVKQVIY